MKKLSLFFATNHYYIMQTCVALMSVLDNNEQAGRLVEINVHVVMEQCTKADYESIRDVCEKYQTKSFLWNAEEWKPFFEQLKISTYKNSYASFYKIIATEFISGDANILCLEGDVCMNRGQGLALVELAEYEFGKKACGSVLDALSSRSVKKANGFESAIEIMNAGVFLINPYLYRKNKCIEKYKKTIAEVGKFEWGADQFLLSYALGDEMNILPFRFEVYPGWALCSYETSKKVYHLGKNEFYNKQEWKEAIANPVFVHYVSYIVSKPWMVANKFDKIEIPYKSLWDYYERKTAYSGKMQTIQVLRKSEMARRFLFLYCRPLWALMCELAMIFIRVRKYKKGRNMQERDRLLYEKTGK